MALALLSDLWVPDIWIPGMREKSATTATIWNSGVVTQTPEMNGLASGAGQTVQVPFFKDITDQDDEIQVEDTAPTVQGITSGKQIGIPCNRVTPNGASALSGAISGTDPVGEMLMQMVERRQKQRQKTLLSILRGLFGTAGARNTAADLSAARLGGTTAEPFDETGLDATSDQKLNPDMFIDGKALFGELANDLAGGVLFLHPNVKAGLEKLDKDGFKTGKPSDLPFTIRTYRDVPIIESESLVRAGTGNGFVYETYLIAKGVIGVGEKPQTASIGDVAHLVLYGDAAKNNQVIYDRTRFLIHILGTKWVASSIAGQSPTNAELATVANWDLAFGAARKCGIVAIRTNG